MTITEGIVTHFKTLLPKPGSECPVPVNEGEGEEEEGCQCQAHSMWDVLLEEKYLNQNLTEEKLAELKSGWNILGKNIAKHDLRGRHAIGVEIKATNLTAKTSGVKIFSADMENHRTLSNPLLDIFS